jgi:hypothetical protein
MFTEMFFMVVKICWHEQYEEKGEIREHRSGCAVGATDHPP